MNELIGCSIKELPEEHKIAAARTAIDLNPTNRPSSVGLDKIMKVEVSDIERPAFIAALTTKIWPASGAKLSVSFMDNPASDLRDRIISHMNAWNQWCNIKFVWSQSQGQVRIARIPGGGYYSFLGTDILHIPANQCTMNLEAFTMNTPESEYKRVVRHETGHTLGFPHEHMRKEIISRLDPRKTVAYFLQTQGWDANTTIQQVLTPLDESALIATPHADETSIMTYQLPASITVDGRPVIGGIDIDPMDQQFAGKLYPLAITPPSPPPPPGPGPNPPPNPPPATGPELVLGADVTGKRVLVDPGAPLHFTDWVNGEFVGVAKKGKYRLVAE